jgi:hypothetical protein
VSNGWEAVTGPAAAVDEVRTLAAADGIGTLTACTGDSETGQAILIFTGDDSVGAFDISGASIHSVDNATDQTWYVFDDSGAPDASIAADIFADIPQWTPNSSPGRLLHRLAPSPLHPLTDPPTHNGAPTHARTSAGEGAPFVQRLQARPKAGSLLALVLVGGRCHLRHPCSDGLPTTPPPSSFVAIGHPRAPSHGPATAQAPP